MSKDNSYKINLPETNFSMKASLTQKEPKILAKWQEMDLYTKICQKNYKNKETKSFLLHDGPPYANGAIHLGHALNKILKDIIIKSKTMRGYYAPYIPGWDCHGLPIELEVEKKFGKEKLATLDFIAKCREYASSQVKRQMDGFKRLGVLGRFDKPYLTMNFSYEANIIRALREIIKNGNLVKGYKPVHWCTSCGSALAEAEVEYADKESFAIDVAFLVADKDAVMAKFAFSTNLPIYGVIWTTTPWTLSANEAISLNPDMAYSFVDCGDKVLILANELRDACLARYNVTSFKILKTAKGSEFEGILFNHPFLAKKEVPAILGTHVTNDSGTGLVHTAPSHGYDDFIVCKKYNIKPTETLDKYGRFVESNEFFAGKSALKVNEEVIALLKTKKALLSETKIVHSYPHCWRHKTPLIFRATAQWFIKLDDGQKEIAINSLKDTNWFPENGRDRLSKMIATRPDWCVSRQRLWCTPMALFVHKKTGDIHPETIKFLDIIANGFAKEGIEYWYKLDASEFLKANSSCHETDADYEKSADTLDVWFDSGVSHYAVAKENPLEFANLDIDLYLEGHDQYRGWFQSSLLSAISISNKPKAPYRDVVVHGHALDANGRKMSKSLGNVVDPNKIVETSGADILRLWVASSFYQDDLNYSDEALQGVIDSYRKIRNTFRYLLGNLAGFDPSADLVEPALMLPFDKEIVRILQNSLSYDDYDRYAIFSVYQNLNSFVTNDLSNFYLDVIKDRLYTMPTKSLARRSAQTAMFHILQYMVRYVAPILSFTAEEIYQEMRNLFTNETAESIFLADFYQLNIADFTDHNFDSDFWSLMKNVREGVYKEIEKVRSDGLIGSSLEAIVSIYTEDETLTKAFAKFINHEQFFQNELHFYFISSQVVLLTEKPDLIHFTKIDVAGKIFYVKVTSTNTQTGFKKCERCWQRVNNFQHDEAICDRCFDNLNSEPEKRKIV